MEKHNCPMKCGKKFITKAHAMSHADIAHPDWMTPKRKGWATPYGFGDFTHPVTYQEACEQIKVINERVNKKWNA